MTTGRQTLGDQATAEKPERAAGVGRLVDNFEFRRLLVSNRRMVRADEPLRALRGLRDLDSGEHFLTDERTLFS